MVVRASGWIPFCFGEYQGVGDPSCGVCPYNKERQCESLAKFRAVKDARDVLAAIVQFVYVQRHAVVKAPKIRRLK